MRGQAALVWLALTFSISPLFLLRAERVILTVTEFSSPWRRRAMRFGCRGLKEISSSGWGKRLVLPFSVEISEESSTDGQPAEPCGTTHDFKVKGHVMVTQERNVSRSEDRGWYVCYYKVWQVFTLVELLLSKMASEGPGYEMLTDHSSPATSKTVMYHLRVL